MRYLDGALKMIENYIKLQFYWIKMLKVDSFRLDMQLIFIWVWFFFFAGTLNTMNFKWIHQKQTANKSDWVVLEYSMLSVVVGLCIVVTENMTTVQFNLISFSQNDSLCCLHLCVLCAVYAMQRISNSLTQSLGRWNAFIVIVSCMCTLFVCFN